ncbi:MULTISPECIES: O-antigen ligase [unclassified Moorena]|uniref:O-antigen ligase family protein n=1 Tax=unclassified Moorena TaxID=2683338 RepID=UPI0025D15FD6|nr:MULTISPECIES: O-antigen ligase family protein [unclassified Moorena]
MMWSNNGPSRFPNPTVLVGSAGVGVGIVTGLLAGINPLLLVLALGAGMVAVLVYCFASFEQIVLGMLILRSSLDIFSKQQLPALFAIGLDALTLLYVTVMLLTGRRVQTDKFWWLFAGWVGLQGLWVILLALGGLGLDSSYISVSIREWVRLFSWLMVYLLIMQLKNRIPPEKIIHMLFLALVLPLTLALIQMIIPSVLPSILSPITNHSATISGGTSRIRGTLGHPNTFVTFILLFIGLTYWKLSHSKQRLLWLLLLGLLAFFFVSTKALFGLMMLATFVLVLIAPRLSLVNLIGGLLFFALVIGLFASSEFGQERLGSIANTPLLNPDIDIWRAILLSKVDHNSFNWRLDQWTYLLTQWQHVPILGYGLGLSDHISTNGLLPHNDYVRSLVEGGLLGLGTFLAFLFAQFVRLVQLLRYAPAGSGQRDLCFILLATLMAIPVGMITENIWSHTNFFFYWYTLLAIAGWNWQRRPPSDSTVVTSTLKPTRFSTRVGN